MKSLIKKLLINAILINKRHRLIKGIQAKNHQLKIQGLYERFPLNKIKPVVSNYPFYHKSDHLWMDFFFSVYKVPVDSFIPITTYNRIIEPTLNIYPLLRAIKDKNSYNRFFKEIKTPVTLLRRMNNFFYDENYKPVNPNKEWMIQQFKNVSEIIIKPSVISGSGQSIMLFTKFNDNHISDNTILDEVFLRNYGNDYIIQARTKQHQFFQQFSDCSSNTLRIFTYRSVRDDRVQILHTLLRIGKKGSFMDHDNLGGVAIGINDEGFLNPYAIDVNGRRHRHFNNIHFQNVAQVPFIDKIHPIAIKIANEIFYGRILALDFIIDEEENILLIEINCNGNGISQYQMNNGSLFKVFTREILDYCKVNAPKNNIFD